MATSTTKIRDWIKEQAPMLATIYENKYVGMLYDRFASLPPKQQRQIILGTAIGLTGIVVLYLGLSYLSLWRLTQSAQNSTAMTNTLLQFQKLKRDKGAQIRFLEKNSQLAAPGQFKSHLQDLGRSNGISPRMMTIEEKETASAPNEEGKPGGEAKMKQATVALQKITLSQLVNFLRALEFGQYTLSISSIKITNDEKLRGYLNVDLGVVAYLFSSEEG